MTFETNIPILQTEQSIINLKQGDLTVGLKYSTQHLPQWQSEMANQLTTKTSEFPKRRLQTTLLKLLLHQPYMIIVLKIHTS